MEKENEKEKIHQFVGGNSSTPKDFADYHNSKPKLVYRLNEKNGKNKLPVFVFSLKNVPGKDILDKTDQSKDVNGNDISRTKRYNLFKDCNGIRIELAD